MPPGRDEPAPRCHGLDHCEATGAQHQLTQPGFPQALPSESRRHLWALAETSYW